MLPCMQKQLYLYWHHMLLYDMGTPDFRDMSIRDVPYYASCMIVQVLTWTTFGILFLILLHTHTFQTLDWKLQILAVSSAQVYTTELLMPWISDTNCFWFIMKSRPYSICLYHWIVLQKNLAPSKNSNTSINNASACNFNSQARSLLKSNPQQVQSPGVVRVK